MSASRAEGGRGPFERRKQAAPRSRLRLDLPTRRDDPRALIIKVGLGVKKSSCGDARRYKEAKDRIAGVSGGHSRARTEIVKADSSPPPVPRNPDYLYSELLYVTRILRAREREKSLAAVFLSSRERAGGRRSACFKLHIRNFNFGV